MIISTDGACKRSGTPECSSVGVAWVIKDDGDMYFLSTYESRRSTSQRGEINGLIKALDIAVEEALDTDGLPPNVVSDAIGYFTVYKSARDYPEKLRPRASLLG